MILISNHLMTDIDLSHCKRKSFHVLSLDSLTIENALAMVNAIHHKFYIGYLVVAHCKL